MSDSILNSVKIAVGQPTDQTPFDAELIMDINTFLGVLNQLGVGKPGFEISDSSSTWEDFLGEGVSMPEVKTWMNMRVMLVFDHTTSSVLTQTLKEQIDELTWRIITKVEYGDAQ